METWRLTHDYDLCAFRSRDDFTMTGRSPSALGDEFTLNDSEYADDTAMPFPSRAVAEEQAPKVVAHFARWGMEVHEGLDDGTVQKDSKSEILFCAARPNVYDDPATFDGADLSHVRMPGGRYFPVVAKFKYLGSYVSRNGDDAVDVDSHIASASKAFGALRGCIFASTHINAAAKRAVYEALILNILLYGAESWSISEAMRHRLRCFHARCVRAMAPTQ